MHTAKFIRRAALVLIFAFNWESINAKEYAIKSESQDHVIDFCRHAGCRFLKQVTSIYYLINCPVPRRRFKTGKEEEKIEDIAKKFNDTITNVEYQHLHKNYPRTLDPKWNTMWNLNNQIQPTMKIQEAWSTGRSGAGVVIAVVDDGVQLNHPDLQQNVNVLNSYDYYNSDVDPTPISVNDSHGTMVTGLVAAVANNNQCIVGVSHHSTVIGIKLLGENGVTDVTEALALNHHLSGVDIYINSWGPPDGYGYSGPGSVTQSAFIDGVTKGRNKKGVIFVWAAGNGGLHDNCNGDGYANSIYTIPITSVDSSGKAAYYAEVCAPVFAATYSGSRYRTLVSTSVPSSCVDGLQGTSFSAPQAAGMIALALQANSALTWRDVQHLVVRTSKRDHLQDGYSSWQRNGAGYYVSQVLGFGLMDAEAMVNKAKTWVSVPEQIRCSTSTFYVHRSTGYSYTSYKVSSSKRITTGDNCKLSDLEHVEVEISFSYTRKEGAVKLYLESPAGTKSHLMTPRPQDSVKYPWSGSKRWYYTSVHYWGESVDGTWILTAESDEPYSVQVTLRSWRLSFYGFFKEKEDESSGLSVGIIVAISLGAVAVIVILIIVIVKLKISAMKRRTTVAPTEGRNTHVRY
ncbi:proprotein convertase subtilisin/kexin type 6-like isoform X1 [Ostrea edulis]|uniref:proprotein convertase subtilisin/kexin type 6-like isoform X1 n=1 Tax=Ostrea edulis TaxID=37623 RepID=UPI0024AF41EC|nr:proprotein convertase subtilisin/kexin type 6-like isoform X1 [Ostrea edulis]